jgi:hypothetical protein
MAGVDVRSDSEKLGNVSVTGASQSSRPSSARLAISRLVIDLVTEPIMKRVSRSMGLGSFVARTPNAPR